MVDVPYISYWMGKPISEIPREELEQLFVAARKEIDNLHRQYLKTSVQHISDLAAMKKHYES